MGARRENAKPTYFRKATACLVNAAMIISLTPAVAWGIEEGTADNPIGLVQDVTTWGDTGINKWYVANSNVTFKNHVEVNGHVHLILADGCSLTIDESKTMTVPSGSTLAIEGNGTIINNGTITNYGTITNNSKLTNAGSIYVEGTLMGTAPANDANGAVYYPLTLNTMGGTVNAIGSGIVEVNDKRYYNSTRGAALPTNVTKSGHTFAGWYDDSGQKVTEIAADSIGDVALTAKWNAVYVPPAVPQAATDVIKLINAIGEVTLDSKEAIEAARTGYDALTDYQKSFVPASTYSKLAAAEEKYKEISTPKPETQAVIDAFAALPMAGELKTSQAKEAVKKAQATLEQVAKLDAGQFMLVDEALIANAQEVVAKGSALIAEADAKAVGKVKNKAFSVKAGKSKSVYFKTLASAAGTKVTYKKSKGSRYITVTKSGKVTAKKGMKKGKTYTARVKVTCSTSSKYVKITVRAK